MDQLLTGLIQDAQTRSEFVKIVGSYIAVHKMKDKLKHTDKQQRINGRFSL